MFYRALSNPSIFTRHHSLGGQNGAGIQSTSTASISKKRTSATGLVGGETSNVSEHHEKIAEDRHRGLGGIGGSGLEDDESVTEDTDEVEEEEQSRQNHPLHSEDLDVFDDPIELKPRHNSIKDSIMSGGEASISIATASASAPTSAGGFREPIYSDLNKTRAIVTSGSTSSNSVHWKTASGTSIERRKSSFVDINGS